MENMTDEALVVGSISNRRGVLVSVAFSLRRQTNVSIVLILQTPTSFKPRYL
jgi:hypothetical protein